MKVSATNGTVLTARNSRRLAIKKYWRENWQYYLLLLPAIAFTIVFAYVPMYGAQIAFRDYKVKLGFWGSEWVGMKHFVRFVTSSNFWPLLRNTLGISVYSLVAGFPAPIILAFMLNELQSSKLRKSVQMITYAPHFISAVAAWGSITSCALYSFARYSMDVCSRVYYRYRDNAMAAFDWVKRTRASSASIEGCISGLFPPMRGNDWGQEFQGWMTTDIINIECLEALTDAAERFNDPRAAEIRAEVNDHMSVMRSIMHKFEVEAGDSDQLRIPLKPDGDDEQLLREFYPYLTASQFTAMGVVTDENVQRVMNYCVASGIYFNGLYGHMPYEDGNMHIWYTSVPDYYWFLTWMRLGKRELAEDIIRCQIRYSMTDEYYMVERYADNDPYYVPWSPNSSANGRLISMLLDFYGDQA